MDYKFLEGRTMSFSFLILYIPKPHPLPTPSAQHRALHIKKKGCFKNTRYNSTLRNRGIVNLWYLYNIINYLKLFGRFILMDIKYV